MIEILVGVASFFVGGIGALLIKKRIENQKKKRARSESEQIVTNAKNEAQRIDRESKTKAKSFEDGARKRVEQDIRRQQDTLRQKEKTVDDKLRTMDQKLKTKEDELSEKLKRTESRSKDIESLESRIKEKEITVQENISKLQQKLEEVSHYSGDEAKRELIETVRAQAEMEAAKKAIVIENAAKEEAEIKAKRIISLAMARYAGEYTSERTVGVIALPSDEMKGRVIGKEGRNIRALEAACGVDLIVDETPEAVVISSFDPVRREIARRTLEVLLQDGRVHPARIEEVVEKVKNDLFKYIKELGEKACFDLGIHGVHGEIIKLIGSLNYRTSYTQNNYSHSMECGFIAGMMAAEMGEDVHAARRAGLLHDIGKALDHSIEGSHAIIGADFAKKHGEAEKICHAIRSHHEDEQPKTTLAYITQTADAISSARPGARRQSTDNYVKRLEDLEAIGNSFDGVIRTFAIQAGREVRVLVEGSKVTDEQSLLLSRDIARKIEKEMNYPGQIKITVVRETRAIDYAR